jgi:hypothetical protein
MSKSSSADSAITDWANRAVTTWGNAKKSKDHQHKAGKVKQAKKTQGYFSKPISIGQARQNLKALVNKKPEVMVKVTGGGRSISGIRAHMKYITQHGDVELENERGEIFNSAEAINDELEAWNDTTLGEKMPNTNAPQSKEKKRNKYGRLLDENGKVLPPSEAVNFVFSMPEGTDPLKLKNAMRDFLEANFSKRHQYVFGLHTDRKHPHVHVAVKSKSFVDQKRLDTRKAAIQGIRLSFVEHLAQHGIEASATPRSTRNALTRATPKRSKVKGKTELEVVVKNTKVTQPMKAIAQEEREGLKKVMAALKASPAKDDQDLATAVDKFLQNKGVEKGVKEDVGRSK